MELERWFCTAREVFTGSKAWEYRRSGGAAGDYYELCAVFSNSDEIIYTPVAVMRRRATA